MSGPGPRLRAGIGLVTAHVPPGSQRSPADEYADTLRIAERAEELGFGSLRTRPQPGLTGRRYNELWRPTGYSPLTQAVWPDGTVG